MARVYGHQDFSQIPVYTSGPSSASTDPQGGVYASQGLNYTSGLRKSYPELALAEREIKGVDFAYLIETLLNVIWQWGGLFCEILFAEGKQEVATQELVTPGGSEYPVNAREYLSAVVLNPYAPERDKRHAKANLARVLIDEDRSLQNRLRQRSDWKALTEVFASEEKSLSLGLLSIHSLRNNLYRGRPGRHECLNIPRLDIRDLEG
ncbi:MAG: hypothetical protein ACR2PX_14095 [Endozoicomonas sp.]|uniref:hypothetical protein n=1 Tax=Endozoicomonas sp. TaxID=1892382 RepID=UPI003D9ABFFB